MTYSQESHDHNDPSFSHRLFREAVGPGYQVATFDERLLGLRTGQPRLLDACCTR